MNQAQVVVCYFLEVDFELFLKTGPNSSPPPPSPPVAVRLPLNWLENVAHLPLFPFPLRCHFLLIVEQRLRNARCDSEVNEVKREIQVNEQK